MKNPPHHSTFGFFADTQKADPKKPKELFLANALSNIDNIFYIEKRDIKYKMTNFEVQFITDR